MFGLTVQKNTVPVAKEVQEPAGHSAPVFQKQREMNVLLSLLSPCYPVLAPKAWDVPITFGVLSRQFRLSLNTSIITLV